MELNMTMPPETKEYIDSLIKGEIEKVKAQVLEEGEKIKRDYIPRENVARFKAAIIELHTDEDGHFFRNAYVSVDMLMDLIKKYLEEGDQEDVKL